MQIPPQATGRPGSQEMWVAHLGTVPYREGLTVQARVQARRQAEELPDTLLLLEHPPVYTRGRRASDAELSLGEGFYRSRGIEIVPTDRGGKVTYHGPGQLVGYPIMRVSDVGIHLRTMEAAIVAALADAGIAACSRRAEGIDYTGVWVEDRKIASIGVHLSRGVSTHGFAVNVTNDLRPFEWIVPCGLSEARMTSVASEGSHETDEQFAELVTHRFCEAHALRAVHVSRTQVDPSRSSPRSASGSTQRLVA